MNCRNQGIEKSTDAEIGAESRAESSTVVDAENEFADGDCARSSMERNASVKRRMPV